jgi:hypothetical protein
MNVEQHAAKAKRIFASLEKLRYPEDYLALVDGALVAGYHLGNALLHRHGVLPESEHANTPSKLSMPVADLPAAIQPAFRAFSELERLRTDFVRSPSAYDPKLATEVPALLQIMRQANG